MEYLTGALRDPHVRGTAYRLTLAAMIAMAIATALELQNPWWAAMATWMIGQPPRGLLLERSAAQLAGTLLGAVAGLAIAQAGSLHFELAGLALWLAFCCGLSSAMRHQRAYGAALAGLTASVIVTLTAGTGIDPSAFALARLGDTVIGIGASLSVGFLLQPRMRAERLRARSDRVLADGLRLIALALRQRQAELVAREAGFLSALAAISAGAEDAAAGSLTARRGLRPLNALFAGLLDLVVVARMIRKASEGDAEHARADLAGLQDELERAAKRLEEAEAFDPLPIVATAERIAAAHARLAPMLGAFAAELHEVSQSRQALSESSTRGSTARLHPRPDMAGLGRAMLRGFLIIALSGGVWIATGWEAGRFIVLGASIFTVLFATLDEPLPLVRQGLIGGALAAMAAVAWRLGVVPVVEVPWVSLLLALPLFFVASALQASRTTIFAGLTFNMFFAVLSRPVDMLLSSPQAVVFGAAMLIAGVAISDAFYRWLVPMDAGRRRRHLEAAIRREIAFISRRAGTPWAERHLARLRHIVLEMVLRARADTGTVGDAVAALSLGHISLRLGQIIREEGASATSRALAENCLRTLAGPIEDPVARGRNIMAASTEPATERVDRVANLAHLMAGELIDHARIFSSHGPARPA
ncbi:FUSC family protein [Aureimonas populi]|uniref:FUSC family protein n=1 Tax=Aureimonas populi TaxID=1701758 RepID=A0ABW5CNL5_9HYPH|nr:FUSC family protein [Aureimonas populi]